MYSIQSFYCLGIYFEILLFLVHLSCFVSLFKSKGFAKTIISLLFEFGTPLLIQTTKQTEKTQGISVFLFDDLNDKTNYIH